MVDSRKILCGLRRCLCHAQGAQLRHDGVFAHNTHGPVARFTAAEIEQGWNALDAKARGELGLFVHIHLRDHRLALQIASDFLQGWREHLAGPAPLAPKVNDNGHAGLKHFAIEVRFIQFKDQLHSSMFFQ